MGKATQIALTEEERTTLQRWVRASTTEQRLAQRARFVLAAADGVSDSELLEPGEDLEPGELASDLTKRASAGEVLEVTGPLPPEAETGGNEVPEE